VSAQYFRFSARPPPDPRRSLLLEQLLARADTSASSSDWRLDAFRVIAPQAATMPAVAAAALFADRGVMEAAWVCIAAPVHYLAEMNNVRLAAEGMPILRPDEAEALALDFNRVWSDSGTHLLAGRSAVLYCILDRTLQVTTRDPEDVIGRHIEEYLPVGGGAPVLKQLMSEIEMWLFEHPVNGARTAQGLTPITGLWLWGGGTAITSLPAIQGFCAGNDVFFSAFTRHAAGGGVIVMPDAPGSDAWHEAESRWLKPAVAQLREGVISRLDLSAGARSFSVSARAILRFWRRRQPWWEWFA
jgi:hypothetical protein